MMKYFWSFIFSLVLGVNMAYGADETTRMVDVENYFSMPLETIGLIDYPPFSRYVRSKKIATANFFYLESAFLKPTKDALKKYKIKLTQPPLHEDDMDLKLMLLDVRSGKYKLFIGAYSNTSLYSGLKLIFPASVSNPIHIIATPESMAKIKGIDDLKNLRGVISKTEQLSDFISRKITALGTEYVDTPYEGYEKLILGKADYMLGGLYYNRMMASHYGVGSFLSYSQKPVFRIPVFFAISKVTPRLSQYMEVFQKVFSSTEYANAFKKEILRIVLKEERAYEGTVPPSFVKNEVDAEDEQLMDLGDIEFVDDSFGEEEKKKVDVNDEQFNFGGESEEDGGIEADDEDEEEDAEEEDEELSDEDLRRFKGHIVEEKVKEKSIDEVLEGI